MPGRALHGSRCTREKTEARRSGGTCPKSHPNKRQKEASLPQTRQLSSQSSLLNPCAWHSTLALRQCQHVVGSGCRGQELGKGSVFIKNRKQSRLELVLKHKIMESFLEIKHMLLNSYSNGFAPGAAVAEPESKLGPIPGQILAACLAGQSAPRLWAEGWRVPDLLRALL